LVISGLLAEALFTISRSFYGLYFLRESWLEVADDGFDLLILARARRVLTAI